jgi:hypothetical protein
MNIYDVLLSKQNEIESFFEDIYFYENNALKVEEIFLQLRHTLMVFTSKKEKVFYDAILLKNPILNYEISALKAGHEKIRGFFLEQLSTISINELQWKIILKELERFILGFNMNDIIEEAKRIFSDEEAVSLGIKFMKM